MEVIADSAEFYRSSAITLEGDRAPKTMMVEFRTVPPGDYEVTAMLIGAGRTPPGDCTGAHQGAQSGVRR